MADAGAAAKRLAAVMALLVVLVAPLGALDPAAPAGAATTSLPATDPFDPSQLSSLLAGGLAITPVPAETAAGLSAVPTTLPVIYADRCHETHYSIAWAPCHFADLAAATNVWLIGDSHGAEWFPALHTIAVAKSWRLTSHTKSGCPPVDGIIPNNPTDPNAGDYIDCQTWNTMILNHLATQRPDLVIIGALTAEINPYHVTQFETYIKKLTALVPHVIVLGDSPYPKFDIPSCIAAHLSDAAACAFLRSTKTAVTGQAVIQTMVSSQTTAIFLPTVDWLCGTTYCPAIIRGIVIYRDGSHLAMVASHDLSTLLSDQLSADVPGL